MKKLKISLLAFCMMFSMFAVSNVTYAGACFSQPVVDQDWYAVAKSAVNLRDVACMDGSTVVGTLSAGAVVHVTKNDDGWLLVEGNGLQGWVWWEFFDATSRPADPAPASEPEPDREPLYDIVGHDYEDAVRFVNDEGIVQGYPDKSYQPDRTLQRDELLKIVIEARYGNEFDNYDGSACFSDVDPTQWYAKYVCFAKDEGIVVGYSDNTFRPTAKINLVEAMKIALIGFGYDTGENGETWYELYVNESASRNFIPLDFRTFEQAMTRAQMAEMITRMVKFDRGTLADYLGTDADMAVTYETLERGVGGIYWMDAGVQQAPVVDGRTPLEAYDDTVADVTKEPTGQINVEVGEFDDAVLRLLATERGCEPAFSIKEMGDDERVFVFACDDQFTPREQIAYWQEVLGVLWVEASYRTNAEAEADPVATSYIVEPELVTFELGEYEINENGKVYFGPLTSTAPEGVEMPMYSMELIEPRELADIESLMLDYQDGEVYVEPREKIVNGFTVIEWSASPICPIALYEVLLETQNVKFSFVNCSDSDVEMDFDYFESIVEGATFG